MTERASHGLFMPVPGVLPGAWAVPPEPCTASVLAAVATCILGPVMVARAPGHEARRAERAK